MGLAGHRFGLPMTFRSCFYPILGEYAWGWMGDVIDGFTIVTTVAGVCTSLGLGAINIVAGFRFLGWVEDDISEDRLTLIQNLTIWGITAMATISVLSGLHQGVQLLSKLAFAIGMLLFFLIFTMVRSSCPPESQRSILSTPSPLTTRFAL
jgi:choline-glycine betaine transporter